MAIGVLLRVGVSLVIALVAGGTGVLRQLPFLVYLVLEGALSIVEGCYARPVARFSRPSAASIPSEQFAFVMSGKRYLLVRLLYHAALVAASATLVLAHPSDKVTLMGAAIMASGVALRAWSMATLGERFRGFEARREAAGLETAGPYALVRHPGYVALALTDLGAPFVLGVPLLAIAWILPAALIVRRVGFEEPLLAAHYPESWPAYAARTSRLIPGVY
jgi:protein-S-isoprenylcysteine O-methyltransferase Ste14